LKESFHFTLTTGRHEDNRIPPKSFDIANAEARLSTPVYYIDGADVGADYFSQGEYEGGFDDVVLSIVPGADYVEVDLYYQTTSRENIKFLRDEINGTGNQTLTGDGGEPPYIIQTDPFFSQFKAWGDTIWNLWSHNMNLGGAAPFLMTSASFGTPSTVGVSTIETGFYEGKGKNRTFIIETSIFQRDTVVIRALVKDGTGLPLSNATVEITIGGPESVSLNGGPSDADGWAEATWQTQNQIRKVKAALLLVPIRLPPQMSPPQALTGKV
jgi:hypothetical protein